MAVISRKWPSIDLIKLYSDYDTYHWNSFLTKAYRQRDVPKLVKIRYGLQAGMSDLEKKKILDDKTIHWVLRAIKSIETTLRKIFNEVNPIDWDKSIQNLYHERNINIKKDLVKYGHKKNRDADFEIFLRRMAF